MNSLLPARLKHLEDLKKTVPCQTNTPPYDASYGKRRIPRHHVLVPIYCKLSRKEESGFGWVRDFSNTGAQVTSSLSLTHGDELTLSLPTTWHPDMEITAAVRWIQGPLLGIEFKPRLTARDALGRVENIHDSPVDATPAWFIPIAYAVGTVVIIVGWILSLLHPRR